jgi:hypothetical protein
MPRGRHHFSLKAVAVASSVEFQRIGARPLGNSCRGDRGCHFTPEVPADAQGISASRQAVIPVGLVVRRTRACFEVGNYRIQCRTGRRSSRCD